MLYLGRPDGGSSRGKPGRYFSLKREAQGRLGDEGQTCGWVCDRARRDRGGRLLCLLDVSRLAGERIIAYLQHGFWENDSCDLEQRGSEVGHRDRPALG